MMKSKARIILGALAVLVTVVSGAMTRVAGAAPAVSYMAASEVKPGMEGYGLTVFEGLEVSKFPVKIKGVMPGAGVSGGPLILIELTGPEREKYGGVSMGMSGSPIYVGGKLIGALSMTFPMTDHHLGGVTDIASMLKAAEYDAPRAGTVEFDAPFEHDGKVFTRISYETGRDEIAGTLFASAAAAPAMVRGVTARTMPFAKRIFEGTGIEVTDAGGAWAGAKTGRTVIGPGSEIKPGSSVAVLLLTGDMEVSAAGTVTHVDGKQALMFGHPLFRKGDVRYLLADAPVLAVARGTDMSFKAAATGALRGEITQDRGPALVGRLDSFPLLIPFDITVTDGDIGKTEKYSFKVARDEDLLSNLAAMAALQSLDNTIDRLGKGTSRVSFSIGCSTCEKPVERENMFYDGDDIAALSLVEFVTALQLLKDNKYADAEARKLNLNVEIDSKNSYALIEKVEIDGGDEEKPEAEETKTGENAASAAELDAKAEEKEPSAAGEKANKEKEKPPVVKRGQKLGLKVSVRPYRSETVEEKIWLKVPADIAPGRAVISVFSGARELPSAAPEMLLIKIQVEGQERQDEKDPHFLRERKKEKSLDEVLKEFSSRPMNNELVANIESLGFSGPDDEDEEEYEDEDRNRDGRAGKLTGWALDGVASIRVEVEDESPKVSPKRNIRKSRINTLKGEK
ncbi:MAG TPA: SpoIVB peptidase S55 domain-containing protein [bacterium]|nr:SpoIVB peptidase S55 domain-containing protein [bacterium]